MCMCDYSQDCRGVGVGWSTLTGAGDLEYVNVSLQVCESVCVL